MNEIIMAQAIDDEFEPFEDKMLGLFECWDINNPNKTIFWKGIISMDLYLDWVNESKKYKKPIFITETFDSFKDMVKLSKSKDSVFISSIEDFYIWDEETEEVSEIFSIDN